MDQQSNNSRPAPREILKPRRLTLLASVAALSMAVLVVGPGGYRPFNLPAWSSSAQAAETIQNSAGFADLVARRRIGLPTVRLEADFRAVSRFGDDVELSLAVERLGGKSLTLALRCCAAADGELRMAMRQVVVTTSLETHEAIAVPPSLR